MSNAECLRCEQMFALSGLDKVKCHHCGALYTFTSESIDGRDVSSSFEFEGFVCIKSEKYSSELACMNPCPSPEMFCKEHLSDNDFVRVQDKIQYYDSCAEEAKAKLEKMNESKRLWLVTEMSGVDEQDGTISNGSNGQD